MSDELSDRVHSLLTEASSALEELPDEFDENPDAVTEDGLSELGAQADDLVKSSDSGELLAALGLASEDGPKSIPAAILTGEPSQVADLRSLLKLSRLSVDREPDAESVGRTLEELQETIGDSDGSDSADSAEPSEEADAEAPGDAHDAETADDEASTSDSGGEAIKSALQTALSDVRDEFGVGRGGDESGDDDGLLGGDDGVLDRGDDDDGGLFDRGDDDTDEDGGLLDRGDDDDEEDEDGDGLLDRDDDDDKEEEDDDDGLVDRGDDGMADQDAGSSGGRAYLRTMPRQDRADMRAVRRHSTMPDR